MGRCPGNVYDKEDRPHIKDDRRRQGGDTRINRKILGGPD